MPDAKLNQTEDSGGDRERSAVNDVFIQYFSDMLQGKISIEDGVVSLGKEWRNQGGDEILKEVSEVFKTEK